MNPLTLAEHHLQSESPALASLLRRIVPAEYSSLASIYSLASKGGSNLESTVLRTPGSSFNPRSARITQLVIVDGNLRTPTYIAASLLSCCPSNYLKDLDTHILGAVDQVALTLANSVNAVLERKTGVSIQEESIIIQAHLLDTLRHIHLNGDEPNKNKSALNEIEATIRSLKLDQQEGVLTIKIAVALQRTRELLESGKPSPQIQRDTYAA